MDETSCGQRLGPWSDQMAFIMSDCGSRLLYYREQQLAYFHSKYELRFLLADDCEMFLLDARFDVSLV